EWNDGPSAASPTNPPDVVKATPRETEGTVSVSTPSSSATDDPDPAGKAPPSSGSQTSTPPASNKYTVDENGQKRLHGIKVMSLQEVSEYSDLGDGICTILDARKRAAYLDGHLPGAYSLDYYQLADQIDDVRDALSADFIIVYCNGGDCEDSLSLAHDLVYEHDVDEWRVWVFEGGYEEWKKAGKNLVEGEERR
ncbi:MAG: rhodanese-like domain-containing protein, partial [Planctomycetes bacterium]|nr:rhodanese-like domain-containing protein [Planctomycetota bacterium]